MDELFTEHVALAAGEVLKERDYAIFCMRHGLLDGEPHTLQEVGNCVGVTRERIRQITKKSAQKIKFRGNSQLRRGETAASCASLILCVEDAMQIGRPGDMHRFWELTRDEAEAMRGLLLYLVRSDLVHDGDFDFKKWDREHVKAVREELAGRRRGEAFKPLLDVVWWPGADSSHSKWAPALQRMREVSGDSSGRTGSFFSKKLSRDVRFESNLEYEFLQRLEFSTDVVSYQEQPLVIPYEYEGRQRTYYPDVFITLTDGRHIVGEVKSRSTLALDENLAKWAALKDYCCSHGYGLLVTDGRREIRSHMRRTVPPAFREALCAAIARGPLGWMEYKRIKETHNATLNDFTAVVLSERLIWTLGPFTLRRGLPRKTLSQPAPSAAPPGHRRRTGW